MLLPTTYSATIIALILTAVLWGLWPSTLKLDRKWRFELYAFDFAIGCLLTALALALTLGNAGSSNTFTFEDNLTIAGKRNIGTAIAAGVLFALGHLLTLAGIVLAGMSTAMPVAGAVALLTGTAVYAIQTHASTGGMSNAGLYYAGAGLAVSALAASYIAQKAGAAAVPRRKGMYAGWKSYILAACGGLFIGAYPMAMESSRNGEIGLGSYAAVLFLAIGALLATPLYSLYFLNLPVQGEAIGVGAYFQGSGKQHVLGLLGGAMWACGAVALYGSAGNTFPDAPKTAAVIAAGLGAAAVGAVSGLTIWKEGSETGKALPTAAALLLAGAVALQFLGA